MQDEPSMRWATYLLLGTHSSSTDHTRIPVFPLREQKCLLVDFDVQYEDFGQGRISRCPQWQDRLTMPQDKMGDSGTRCLIQSVRQIMQTCT